MMVLVDTNILGRYVQTSHPHHALVFEAIRELAITGHQLRLVPQVVYEFWVVATRPTAQNGLGLSVESTHQRVRDFLELFPLLRDERGVFEPWLHLVYSTLCQGKVAHDARLVAAMKRHRIQKILTINAVDFRRYSGITVLEPAFVAASGGSRPQ